jgi:hypothetical protein
MGPDSATTPPELIRALPRSITITGRGILNACMSLLFFAVSAAMFYWLGNHGLSMMQKRAALRANGSVVIGTVTVLRHVGRSHTPHAHYTFTIDGTSYIGESNVPTRLESEFQPFDEVSIRYLPDNPAVNHPADWEDSTLSAWGPLFAPTMFVVLGIVMAITQFRQRSLLAEGTPTTGTITACTLYKGSYNMKYEFTTADGQSINGRSSRTDGQEIGASVCILYLTHEPTRNSLYPSDYYRIAD